MTKKKRQWIFSADKHGFTWGPLSVVCIHSDDRGVMIELQSKRQAVQVWVTPTGLIRRRIPVA